MKLGQINNPHLSAVLNKIGTCECLPAEGVWKYKRLTKWLAEELKLIEETRLEIIKKHCVLDEHGNPKMKTDKDHNPTNQIDFEEGKMDGFVKEFNEFLENDFEVKVKFHFKEIESAKITGQDLVVLDDLVFEEKE